MIKASQLAACVGKNKYCDVKEALIQMWHENHPSEAIESILKPERIIASVTGENIKDKVLEEDANAEQIVSEILSKEPAKPVESKEEKELLVKAVDHIISTSKGIQGEQSTIDMYATLRGVKVKEGNDHLRRFPIQPKWWLIGVTDAHHTDTHLPVIIEVKTRRNHLFRGIPEYEKVQLHAYMYLYRCTSITWVQRYKDKVTWKDIEWDKEFWNEVLQGVKEFCAEYKKLEKMSKEERTTWTNS